MEQQGPNRGSIANIETMRFLRIASSKRKKRDVITEFGFFDWFLDHEESTIESR